MYPTLESRSDILKMLDELTQGRKQILERCGRLTTAQLSDPVYAGTWSLLKNLAHLAFVEAWMLAWIQQRPGPLPREGRPVEPALELETIRQALDEAHAAVIAFVKGQPEAVLKDRCQFGKQTEQTVGGVLFHLIEHEIHHRGFITHKLTRLEQPPATK